MMERQTIRRGLALLLAFLPLALLAQVEAPDYEARAINASKHWLDIDYVGDGHLGHKLDIHLPPIQKERYPVVICIYGSAFLSNHSKGKTFMVGVGQALLEAGYAVVAINHRASTDAIFPAQIHDVKAAIRFVRANAGIFSLDENFIGITGWSSGGHLSAFAGSSNGVDSFVLEGDTIQIEGDLGAYTKFSSRVDAVVDWYGPTDFLIMDDCGSAMQHNDARSPESLLVGGPIQDNQNKSRLADPATYISAQSAPFLILHGDADPLVPHCQSEHLYDRLKAGQIPAELILIEGGKHGPGVLIPEYIQKMVAFFDQQQP